MGETSAREEKQTAEAWFFRTFAIYQLNCFGGSNRRMFSPSSCRFCTHPAFQIVTLKSRFFRLSKEEFHDQNGTALQQNFPQMVSGFMKEFTRPLKIIL